MGRAPKYDVQELEHLAIAWRNATRDNVKGADKKVEVHTAIIENNMKCLAPPGVSDDKYHGRGGERLHQYWRDTIAPELQKFNSALRIVKLSRPTGVGQDEIISMAIAIHQQETKKMDYAFKNYSHDKWRFYKAWLVAKDEPKFAYNAGETATIIIGHDGIHDGIVICFVHSQEVLCVSFLRRRLSRLRRRLGLECLMIFLMISITGHPVSWSGDK